MKILSNIFFALLLYPICLNGQVQNNGNLQMHARGNVGLYGNFTVALAKNGTVISSPNQSTGAMVNNQVFNLILETQVDMLTNDYIEIFIKTTTSNTPVTITDLQFRIRD